MTSIPNWTALVTMWLEAESQVLQLVAGRLVEDTRGSLISTVRQFSYRC